MSCWQKLYSILQSSTIGWKNLHLCLFVLPSISVTWWHFLLYRGRFLVWAFGLCSLYQEFHYTRVWYIGVLLHTFYCNFGQAEEYHLLCLGSLLNWGFTVAYLFGQCMTFQKVILFQKVWRWPSVKSKFSGLNLPPQRRQQTRHTRVFNICFYFFSHLPH